MSGEVVGMAHIAQQREAKILKPRKRNKIKPIPIPASTCDDSPCDLAKSPMHTASTTTLDDKQGKKGHNVNPKIKQKRKVPREKHVSGNPFLCKVCGKVFNIYTSWKKHEKLMHVNGRPFICEQCGSSFKSKASLTSHIQTHGDRVFICETCGMGFKTSTTLRHHLRIHKDPAFGCKYCDRRFRSPQGYKNHVVQEHNDKIKTDWQVSKCDICHKSFGTKKQLSEHMPIHTGIKPFKCDICSKSYPTNGTLMKHVRMHTRTRRFVCYVCDSGFFRVTKFRRHMEAQSHIKACKEVNIHPEGNLADYLAAFEEDRFTKMVLSVGNLDSSRKPLSCPKTAQSRTMSSS